MKVCIFDIKRFALHDGPGIRTTVFFKGCPLACPWCHNPEGILQGIERYTEEVMLDGVSLRKEVEVGRWIGVEELMAELERDRIFMEESGGGITFSGGEPLQQAEALFLLLDLSRERGLHTCVDTSGYTTAENMKKVCSRADLILFDLKTTDVEKHKKYTGVSNRRILENLSIAVSSTARVNLRIPMVAGFNDSEEDILGMLEYLHGLKGLENLDILPYHAFGTHKYRRFGKESVNQDFKTPAEQWIRQVSERFSGAGFRVRIGG